MKHQISRKLRRNLFIHKKYELFHIILVIVSIISSSKRISFIKVSFLIFSDYCEFIHLPVVIFIMPPTQIFFVASTMIIVNIVEYEWFGDDNIMVGNGTNIVLNNRCLCSVFSKEINEGYCRYFCV